MSFSNPVPGGRLTDAFGMRNAIQGVVGAGDHTGRDIAADAGTPILAAQSGVVIRKWWDVFAATGAGAGGNMIAILGDDGLEVRYAHMAEPSPLNVGDRVTEAETFVGEVGATGAATGPHLHLETLKNGRYVDPDIYLATASAAASPITPKEDDEMQSIVVNNNQYGITWQGITHYGDSRQAEKTRQVTSSTDELHKLTVDGKPAETNKNFAALLDGHGIPRYVLDDQGRVLNPETGKHEANGTWSREREIIANERKILEMLARLGGK